MFNIQMIIIFNTGIKQKGTILTVTEHVRVDERNGKFCLVLCDIYQQINFWKNIENPLSIGGIGCMIENSQQLEQMGKIAF